MKEDPTKRRRRLKKIEASRAKRDKSWRFCGKRLVGQQARGR